MENNKNSQYYNYNLNNNSKSLSINTEDCSKRETKLENNLQNENHIHNNITILSNLNYYNKKINELKKLLKNNVNNISCTIHSLPLNIICIDERKKICSQCALNDIHSNHQIITEKEFLNNIKKLFIIFQEIDKSQIPILSNNNSTNVKNIIENINLNFNKLIELVDETKEKIIQNINKQCQKIKTFLNKRKDEIKKKYQNNNLDINNLRDSAMNWMQNVNNKINQINNINETNFDLITLIDDKHDKNISNLIRSGKQLKDRFIFAQEYIKIINNLDEFRKNGIKIEPNYNVINSIFNLNDNSEKSDNNNNDLLNNSEDKDNKENDNKNKNKDNIKITLFNIVENYNLIDLLHLEFSEFDIKEKSKIDKNASKENINNNIITNKNPDKSLINIDEININEDTLLISPHAINYNDHTNPSTSTILVNDFENININNNNINNINNINIINKEEIKNESNNVGNKNKKINYIITKKITGLNHINKNKDSINLNNRSLYHQENKDINNIKKIKLKDNYLKPLYKMTSEETIITSYSRSPISRRKDNQSIYS